MNHDMELVMDPVCGMQFDPREAAATSTDGNRTIYFCAESCRLAFDASPADFVHDGTASGAGCCSAGHSRHAGERAGGS